MLMSQSAFAKSIGRSRQYINKLVKNGVIPSYDKKRVKPEEAKQKIQEHEDPSRDSQRKTNADNRSHNSDLFSDENLPQSSLADLSDDELAAIASEKSKAIAEVKNTLEQSKELNLKIDDVDLEDMSIADIRKLTEYVSYQLKTHDLADKTGKSVSVDDVKSQAFEMARSVRNAILSLPPRLAPILASETNRHTIQQLLITEITQALESLSHE